MKTTGIVRRIDDLGRIVIPKEIRKNLRISDGESIEIFIEEENIILKKHSVLNKIEDFAEKFTEVLFLFLKSNIIITDTDRIIAFSGSQKKEYINKSISDYIRECIKQRENKHEKSIKSIKLTNEKTIEGTFCLSTIITSGDAVGSVIVFDTEGIVSDSDMKMCQIASKFLSRTLED